MSAGDGSYTLTDVPTGSRLITASATGYEPDTQAATVDENATTTVDFALTEAQEPAGSSVACITYTTSGGPNDNKHMGILISVVDDLGDPVAGVEVRISVTRDGQPWATGTGAITDSNGVATYSAKNAADATYETTVTDVIGGPVFDGATPENLFRKGVDPTPDADCAGDAPQPSGATAQGALNLRAAIGRAIAARAAAEPRLFALDGVVGAGVGLGADGDPVIEVYLDRDRPGTRARIPGAVGGYATRVTVTGPFEAY